MKTPRSFNMILYPKKTISINGAIYDVDLTHDEFLNEFMDWVESRGWSFMGLTEVTSAEKASEELLSQMKAENNEENEED